MNRAYKFEPSVSDLQPLFPYFLRVLNVLLSNSEIKKTINFKIETSKCFYFRTPVVVFPV